jgi:3-methylfumaryl-CoA hydratase
MRAEESIMTDTEPDLAALQGWVGRSEVAEDEAAAPLIRRLAALLDLDPAPFTRGAALPEGWYAILFPAVARQSQLGPDGHPRRGDFLPPVPLPRRMFAGRRVRFLAPIRIGAELRRTSTIAAVTPKQGRSGRMVFVRVDHAITDGTTTLVHEEQDIVYREEPAPGAKPAAPETPPALPPADATEVFAPDTVTLFRYSAITFNGHRIHYDADYTRGEEGYPALVVNGGLTALRLIEMAKRHLPDGRIARFAVRNVNPFFVTRHAELRCRIEEPGKLSLWAVDDTGRVLAQAEAGSAP